MIDGGDSLGGDLLGMSDLLVFGRHVGWWGSKWFKGGL